MFCDTTMNTLLEAKTKYGTDDPELCKALDAGIEALHKQIPQNVLTENDEMSGIAYICPVCKTQIYGARPAFCYECGQKLNWE